MQVKFAERSYTGKAASVDVIDASVRAYVNTVNKAVYEEKKEQERKLSK